MDSQSTQVHRKDSSPVSAEDSLSCLFYPTLTPEPEQLRIPTGRKVSGKCWRWAAAAGAAGLLVLLLLVMHPLPGSIGETLEESRSTEVPDTIPASLPQEEPASTMETEKPDLQTTPASQTYKQLVPQNGNQAPVWVAGGNEQPAAPNGNSGNSGQDNQQSVQPDSGGSSQTPQQITPENADQPEPPAQSGGTAEPAPQQPPASNEVTPPEIPDIPQAQEADPVEPAAPAPAEPAAPEEVPYCPPMPDVEPMEDPLPMDEIVLPDQPAT